MTNHLELFAKYRSHLFRQAYRMLGSVMDAEDLLQETFLHWQQTGLKTIRSPKAFLTTVVRNLCRNHLSSARVRYEDSLEAVTPAQVAVSIPSPETRESLRESLTTAFRLLLERLPPKERLVFLLREVFDYEYEEIGMIIRKSATNCRQILRRARKHITASRPSFMPTAEQIEKLVRQFTLSCSNGDLENLVSVLS